MSNNSKQQYGLTSQEVAQSKLKHGNNAMSVKESETFFSIFKGAFDDPWIKVLCGALLLKIFLNILGQMIPELGHSDWYEAISLIMAILLSTGFAAFSEWKNGKEFNILQAEASKIKTKVYRDGHLQEIGIDDIVIGDAVQLRAGDQIPADGYILKGKLKVDQASLNGESEEAKKEELGDNEPPKSNDTFNKYLLLRGSNVTEGEAIMIVTEIGDKTMMGSINQSLQEDGKESPSKSKLERLAKEIGILGSGAAILYAIINILLTIVYPPENVILFGLGILMYSVVIIIMAVPEGLPMMLAMVSSMNSGRLLKQNILVRHADTIETAGYMDILFSDKTGTITEGKLTVVDVLFANGTIKTVGDSINTLNDKVKKELEYGLGYNNDSTIFDGVAIDSNQTDRALMDFLYAHNISPETKDGIVEKEAFTSATKYASITLENGDKYIKGAPEFILNNVKYYLDENGKQKEFTKEIQEQFTQSSVEQANRSMRILAIIKENTKQEKVLLFGVCIRDNVREGIKETVETMNKAGVTVVMVTGDRKETAIAIAKESGIYKNEDDVVLTHDELEALSDDEIKELLPRLKVVARALPLDKKRLVNIAQELDHVVGMTGDGTNDSASLKAADVGFSMGDGTQVAQGASDIVILNNSLTSIEKAVLFGRTMTLSVKKFIIFQLTVNVTTLAMALLAPLFGFKEPFTIIQILWINLVMDTLAALAFGEEPPLDKYMKEQPTPRNASILTKYMKTAIGTAALFITLGCLTILNGWFNAHNILDIHNVGEISTFMFTFFIFAIIFNAFNTRSKGFNLLEHIGENKRFIYVMSAIAIVQTLIIQFGGVVFSTVPMDLKHYALALMLAFLIIPFDLMRKTLIK